MLDDFASTLQILSRETVKKGASNLSRDERDQAVHYVEDFIGCGTLIGNPTIDAYVLGKKYSEKVEQVIRVGGRGKVSICIFDQLIDIAEKRLFGLRIS